MPSRFVPLRRAHPGCRGVLERLLKNGAWGTVGTGAGRVLNLLAMILLARSLSLKDFGYFALIQSTLGVFAVFAGAGLGITATRYLAEHRRDDLLRAGRIVGMVWGSTFITVGIVLVIVLAQARWIGAEVAQAGDANRFAVAFALGGVFLALQTFRGIQEGVLFGLERFRNCAGLRLAEGLAVLAVMPALAHFYGLTGAVVGQCMALALALLAGHFVVRRATSQAGIATDWSGLRREWPVLRSFTLPSLLSNTVGTPVLWFGIWMLSRQPEGITQIALYNAAYQWHGPLIFIPMTLCAAGLPIMVQTWAAGDTRQFRRMFLILSAVAFAAGLLPALVMIGLRQPIMASYGPEYLAGQGALMLLLLAAPLHAMAKIGTVALQGMERAWVEMGSNVLWALLFLAAVYAVVPKWGAVGLAGALAVAYAVLVLFRLLYTLLLVKKAGMR